MPIPPAPTADDVLASLRMAPSARPRLLLVPDGIAGLRATAAAPAWRPLARRVLDAATAMIDLPPPQRRMDGHRLLEVSRHVQKRIVFGATAWHLTGDARHRDQAREAMLAAAGFSDWNPAHFLDTAEMCAGLAIGLDWLHDDLRPDERDRIARAIIDLGLRAGEGDHWWLRATHNWNQVCHGGLVLGALAVRDRVPDQAAAVIARALALLPAAMAEYAPDGAYPEGPGYWEYGTTFNVLLIAALESVLGHDHGFADAPGFAASAVYHHHCRGPTGLRFSYGDCGTGDPDAVTPVTAWFARRFALPALVDPATFRQCPAVAADGSGDRFLPLALLWGDADPPPADPLPRSWRGDGPSAVAMHRSGWDGAATWIGVKAGSPGVNHGHMDVGSFVLEAKGTRWVEDIGMEDYGRLEAAGVALWEGGQDGQRWTILRYHNRAHSTLCIDGAGQRVAGSAPIVHADLAGEERRTVMDLAPVYAGQLGRAVRTITLRPDASVLVHDDLQLAAAGTVRWTLPTRATPVILAPGLLRLDRDGASLWVRCRTPGLIWTARSARPDRACENPNDGISLLTLDLAAPAGAAATITVELLREPPPGS